MLRHGLLVLFLLMALAVATFVFFSHGSSHLLWTKDSGTQRATGVSIGPDGNIYLADVSLRAVTPDGDMIWSVDAPGGKRFSARAVKPAFDSKGNIYIASNGEVLAYAADSSLIWSCPIPSRTGGRVYVDSNGVYANNVGELIALDFDGSHRWTYTHSHISLGYPIADDAGGIYLSFTEIVTPKSTFNEWLIRLDSGGKEDWKVKLPSRAQTLVFAANQQRLYVGADSGIYCYDKAGNQDWGTLSGQQIFGGIVFDNEGIAYCAGSGKNLTVHAVRSDGTVKWSMTYPGVQSSYSEMSRDQPALLGSSLYVSTSYLGSSISNPIQALFRNLVGGRTANANPAIPGRLLAIDTGSGQLQWEHRARESLENYVVVGLDQTLYVAGGDGHLFAFEP